MLCYKKRNFLFCYFIWKASINSKVKLISQSKRAQNNYDGSMLSF